MIPKEIGGYLEFISGHEQKSPPHQIEFNLARSALIAELKARNCQRLWIPEYICEVIPNFLSKHQIPFTYYKLNPQLLPVNIPILAEDEHLLLVNYFGILDQAINTIIPSIPPKKLIIDASQAYFYTPTEDICTIYSPRKFFSLPDGGILRFPHPDINAKTLHQDYSAQRIEMLFGRLEQGASAHYAQFSQIESSFAHADILQMSPSTRALWQAQNTSWIQQQRQIHFQFLHKILQPYNEIQIDPLAITPLCYPLKLSQSLRQYLIQNRIYVPQFWCNQREDLKNNPWQKWSETLLALPLDQRYQIEDMQMITELILAGLNP